MRLSLQVGPQPVGPHRKVPVTHIPRLNLGSVLHGLPIHSVGHILIVSVETVVPVLGGLVLVVLAMAARRLRRPFRLR